MILRDVEEVEVIPIPFDLRALDHLEPQFLEGRAYLTHHLCDRVQPACRESPAGEGHVQRVEDRRTPRLCLQFLLRQPLLQQRLYPVPGLADLAPGLDRHLRDPSQDPRQPSPAAKVLDAPRFQRPAVKRIQPRQRLKRLLAHLVD